MTAKQETEFEAFGCASRCLIVIANARGAGLTKAQFIDKYTAQYWVQSDKCGGLALEQIREIANDLGLARDVQESTDFSEVRRHIRHLLICSLLVYTQKRYETDGSLSDYHHCTLVSPTALQGDDLLYLDVDYTSGHGKGLFLPESSIAPLIPTFLLFLP